MSTEHPQHTRGRDERPRAGRDQQSARRRDLWRVLLVAELLTFASSWVAFWLTLEVVPAGIGFTEQNPVVDVLLGWSTTGLAVFSLCGLATAFVLLRFAGVRVTGQAGVLLLAASAGAVAALNLVDAGWNLLLLTGTDAMSAVGTPGPAALVFGLGAVLYLCTVPLLFRRRDTA
jgi:hypothetical protein